MLIQTEEQFELAVSTMLDADILVVDTETHFIVPGVPTRMMGVVVYCPVKGREQYEVSFYFPFDHRHQPSLFPSENLPKEWLRRLKVALEREDVIQIYHNAKFDIAVLEREDIIIKPSQLVDTQIMSHMVNENSLHNHKLKRLGSEILGIDAGAEEKKLNDLAKILGDGDKAVGWSLIPPDAMAIYAEKDVWLTWQLYQHFKPELEKQEFHTCEVNGVNLIDREEQYLYFLRNMEKNGVLINQERALELAEFCSARREEIQDEIGFDPMKPDRLARKLFGAKPAGLGFPLQKLGKPSKSHPQGRPVMDKHVLSRFDHPVVERVLEYRGLVKAESTWFRGFLDTIWPDGRVHPDFRQTGTVTTRLSCAGPNMQQLPREDEEEDDPERVPVRHHVKSMILAPPGFEVWEFDYSQLEPRLATCYSKQPELIAVWEEGRDFYQEIANTLGITRYMAKQLMLAIMYGAGKAKTAEMLGIEQSQSEMIVAEFWSAYPMLGSAVQAASGAASNRGWIRLWTGRRRHFLWPSEYHKAFNSAMQGGGAEIVKEAGLKLMRELPEIRVISQVHDSYWTEIPKGRPDLRAQIKEIMEWPNEIFPVPFTVEGKCLAA